MLKVSAKSRLDGKSVPLERVSFSRTLEKQIQSNTILRKSTALIFGDKQLAFGKLNEASNRLARAILFQLRQNSPNLPVNPENCICTYVSASDIHVITWLAVTKIGVGILPLTPSMSKERAQSVLREANPLCILVDREFEESFKDKALTACLQNKPVFHIQDLIKQSVEKTISSNDLKDEEMIQVPTPHDIFFLISTSGTTGVPKIAPVRHIAALNNAYWFLNTLPYTHGDIYLTHGSLLTGWTETFVTLLRGATQIILTEEQHKNPEVVAKSIDKHKITRVFFFSPSFLANVLLYLKVQDDQKVCSTIKSVICNSETLSVSLVQDFFDYFSADTVLYNGYGMCETGGDMVLAECFENVKALDRGSYEGKVSIGKPLQNTNVYVTDENFQLVEKGKSGNLCVSGPSILTSYLNSKSPSIRQNMHSQKPGHELIFKTGDYAKIVNDIVIYEGRDAHHIKIRGFRLHTGEVETCILKHLPEIQSVVVIGIESSAYQVELASFFTVKPGNTVKDSDVIAVCNKHLDEYKVPSLVYKLDAIPVKQPNDKVDRERLQEIHYKRTHADITSKIHDTRKLDVTTEVLFSAVSEAFNIPKPVLHEDINVFDIGGNSINIVQIWTKLKAKGYHLSIHDLLASRTLSGVIQKMNARDVESKDKDANDKYEVVNLFAQPDADDVLHMVAMDFSKRSDIIKHCGVDYQQFYTLVKEFFWDHLKKSNFSQVVCDRQTGKFLATTLHTIDPYTDDIDMESVLVKFPHLTPVWILLDMVEGHLKKVVKEHLPKKSAYGWFMAVNHDLNAEETLKVMKMLDAADIARAKKEGIKRFVGSTLHVVAQALGEDAGYFTLITQKANEVEVDGVKLFKECSDDAMVASQVLPIEDKNEISIIKEKLNIA